MNIKDRLDAFSGEWIRTVKRVEDAISRKDFASAHDVITLWNFDPDEIGGNFVSYEGSRHLDFAADLFLKEQRLQQKLPHKAARKALIDAFYHQVLRAKKGKKASIEGLLVAAERHLHAVERLDGWYVFPLLFASSATKTNSRIGPVRIVARAIFQNEYSASLQKADDDDRINGCRALPSVGIIMPKVTTMSSLSK